MSKTEETSDATNDELAVLKERATSMGITFHPSIGLDKLREKVNARIAEPAPAEVTPAPAPAQRQTPELSERMRAMHEATRLVRIRVTCMNPAKASWLGEIFTVANSQIGTVKKYVPFNVDAGWHVPNIIYQMLKERECQIFIQGKSVKGVPVVIPKLIKEFAIEVLPNLSKQELKELARIQAMESAKGD